MFDAEPGGNANGLSSVLPRKAHARRRPSMSISSHSRRRAVVASMVALALVAAGPSAFAKTKHKPKPKPKPVCNLVTDPKGNEGPSQNGQVWADPALDIVSADVASDSKNVTVAIRVAKLSIPDSMAPAGLYYSFSFVGSQSQIGHILDVRIAPTASGSWAPVWQDGKSGTGVIDTVHNEIRITQPLSFFGTGANAVVPGGPPFHNFTVQSDWANPGLEQGLTNGQMGQVANNTTGTYVMGTPSCVPVGHSRSSMRRQPR